MLLSVFLDPSAVLVGGVGVLCVLWWLSTRRPLGLPPGPGPALPLLGHLHLLPKDPREKFRAWRRRYGDVFSLYLGPKLTVVLASYSAIRQALVSMPDAFLDRPQDFNMDQLIRNKGIIGSSGRTWREQRKTSLSILRAMGMGRNVLADKIQEEVAHYVRAIKDHQGAAVDVSQMTQVSVANNICSIIMGARFHYHDPHFLACLHMLRENFSMIAGTAVLNYLPVLGHLPGDPLRKHTALANSDALFAFVGQHVADHRARLQEDGELADTDFIFCYLRHMQEARAGGHLDTTLTEEGLINSVVDVFLGGADSTSNLIMWALLLFLHHPLVQEKCFQEISEVLGPHRPPSMSDRPQLVYLEATIQEVMRRADIGPLAGVHAASHDVTFRDYVIPKGTTVLIDLSSVLQDPKIWGDPENFRPERFIGPDGKLTKPDEFIPFLTGRRMCLGESLARMEMFLYMANLIQHFRFLPPEDEQLPSLEGEFSIVVSPFPYKIRAVPRV
ncbi:hypothetical protein ACOMHN_004326 [Nucella lapillus]